jgi:hypothetical protein
MGKAEILHLPEDLIWLQKKTDVDALQAMSTTQCRQ